MADDSKHRFWKWLTRRGEDRAMPEAASFDQLLEGIRPQVTPEQSEWLTKRWHRRLTDMRKNETHNRVLFYVVQSVALGGTVVLPPLISLGSRTGAARSTAIVISILVALATVLERVIRFGPRWRLCRRTADQMTLHGWQFFEQLQPYRMADRDARLRLFQHNIEALMESYSRDYLIDVVILSHGEGEPAPTAAQS
jgi:hypothetical protein